MAKIKQTEPVDPNRDDEPQTDAPVVEGTIDNVDPKAETDEVVQSTAKNASTAPANDGMPDHVTTANPSVGGQYVMIGGGRKVPVSEAE